jgi:hypothetical protein
MASLNVQQLTNLDVPSYDLEPKNITITEKDGSSKIVNKNYATVLDGYNIVKLGYCCEPKGFVFPIFLSINGNDYKQFYIGSNGMFECQRENDEDDFLITGVKVPVDISFKLDFATLVI